MFWFFHSHYFGACLALVVFSLLLRAVKQLDNERVIRWENRLACSIPSHYQAELIGGESEGSQCR